MSTSRVKENGPKFDKSEMNWLSNLKYNFFCKSLSYLKCGESQLERIIGVSVNHWGKFHGCVQNLHFCVFVPIKLQFSSHERVYGSTYDELLYKQNHHSSNVSTKSPEMNQKCLNPLNPLQVEFGMFNII